MYNWKSSNERLILVDDGTEERVVVFATHGHLKIYQNLINGTWLAILL